jgi:hypothetical protein
MNTFNTLDFIIQNVSIKGKSGIEALQKLDKCISQKNDRLFIINKKIPLHNNLDLIYKDVCNGKIYEELERYCPNGRFLLDITYGNGLPFYTIFAVNKDCDQDCDQDNQNYVQNNQHYE